MSAHDDDWEETGQVEVPLTGAAPAPRRSPALVTLPARGDDGRATARAALAKIGELGRRFEEHSKADSEALTKIDTKLDAHGTTLTRLETNLGWLITEREREREHAKLQAMADSAAQRQITAVEAREFREQQAHRRARWLVILGQFGPPLAAIISAAVALMLAGKC